MDYANNTVTSENLIEVDEKKITPTKYYETKDALTDAENKLKKTQQQLSLEKNKNAKKQAKKEKQEEKPTYSEKEEKKTEVVVVESAKKEESDTSIEDKNDEESLEVEEYFGLESDELFDTNEQENSPAINSKSEPISSKNEDDVQPKESKIISEKELIDEAEKQTGLSNLFYEFNSLEEFLEDNITFQNIENFLKYLLNDTLCITDTTRLQDGYKMDTNSLQNGYNTDTTRIQHGYKMVAAQHLY